MYVLIDYVTGLNLKYLLTKYMYIMYNYTRLQYIGTSHLNLLTGIPNKID